MGSQKQCGSHGKQPGIASPEEIIIVNKNKLCAALRHAVIILITRVELLDCLGEDAEADDGSHT